MFKNSLLLALVLLTFLNIAFADYGQGDMTEEAVLYDNPNPLMATDSGRISLIIPAILIIVAIVSFAIDFGSVGVTASCMIALILLGAIGIVAISWYSITAMVILGGILMFKLSQ